MYLLEARDQFLDARAAHQKDLPLPPRVHSVLAPLIFCTSFPPSDNFFAVGIVLVYSRRVNAR